MLRISEFAKLSQVSIKTLRYYDEIGLFQPKQVDTSSGYRLYTIEQLPRIHRIMALKELGLSLEQVNDLLQEDIESAEMRAMLKLKKTEISQLVREESRRLDRIEFHLQMLEAEQNFPKLDVVMKRLEPMRALSLFVEPFHTQMAMAKILRKVFNEGIVQHTGKMFDVFHGERILPFGSPDLEPRQHELLLGVKRGQSDVTIAGAGDWKLRQIPAFPLAATLMLSSEGKEFVGYEKVVLLQRWAIENGYKPLGQVRHLHHRGPFHTLDRNEFIIEAQIPVDHEE